MKVTESFAVEATEEVRKDPRFEWYVNWIFTISKKTIPISSYYSHLFIGLSTKGIVTNYTTKYNFDKIITIDEVYSRYGKEIYEANGIEQPKEDCNILGYFFNGKLYKTLNELRGRTMSEDNKPIPLYAKEPFQGSREYDEKLLNDYIDYQNNGGWRINPFLNNRYPNESILKQIAEHKAKIEELRKQLNTKTK